VLPLLVALLGITEAAPSAGAAAMPPTTPLEAVSPEPAPADGEPVPSVRVTVAPAQSRALLGTDKEIDVVVEVGGTDAASFKPVRALATVGLMELPRATDTPGHFVGRYFLPSERYPQVALLVVEIGGSGRRLHASAAIILEGSTAVPFHTGPGASVTMRIGEQSFGPVSADRQGRAEIPIRVPPGISVGLARATDRNGTRETQVDLQLPPFPRVLLMAPPAVEAGSFAEVTVLALAPDGTPAASESLSLAATGGVVHTLGTEVPGEARFLFEAPRRLEGGAVALTATAGGAPGALPARADAAVPLRPGPPARLVVTATTHTVVVGSGGGALMTFSARDAFGNATSTNGVVTFVDGEPREVAIDMAGAATLAVPAPGSYAGRDIITIEGRLGALVARDELRITGGAPASVTLALGAPRIVADGRQGVDVRIEAIDRHGTPTDIQEITWRIPDGEVRDVRGPSGGAYSATYIPDRVREPRRHVIGVVVAPGVSADAGLEVTPPPERVLFGARAGVFYNLGYTVGSAFFAEAMRPFQVKRQRFLAGVAVGYLRDDLTLDRVGTSQAQLSTDQLPVLGLARWRRTLTPQLELGADLGAGVSFVRTVLSVGSPNTPGATPGDVMGTAHPLAVAAGGELGVRLRPGRLVVGLRYLWIDIGRTSRGDVLNGNSVGLLGDIGYRMAF
jgi:hypothetical protein